MEPCIELITWQFLKYLAVASEVLSFCTAFLLLISSCHYIKKKRDPSKIEPTDLLLGPGLPDLVLSSLDRHWIGILTSLLLVSSCVITVIYSNYLSCLDYLVLSCVISLSPYLSLSISLSLTLFSPRWR